MALFKSYNRKSIILAPFLLIILAFCLIFNWNNLQDLWIGSKVECYIYLKNEPKSVLFDITKNSFENLESKKMTKYVGKDGIL